MTQYENLQRDIEIIDKLKNNQLETPNDLTIAMGQLIKKAREEKGMSQAELAQEMKRRQGTISAIELGKSDISILTLFSFSLTLRKPISYFLPTSFIKDLVYDVKNADEEQILKDFKELEMLGEAELGLRQMDLLVNYFIEMQKAAEEGIIDLD